jgi:hypothetical protein
MIFLANVEYEVTHYGSYKGEDCKEYRLVIAKDANEAKEKIREYFHDQTSDYSIYYSVNNITVLETIF